MSLLKGETLNRRGITSWSVINPLGISVVDGPGIDPTGATDSTVAIQALFDALPASGGAVHFPLGSFWVEGIVCAKPVTITGNGGLLIGDGGLSPIRAATTLVSKSTTGHCLTLSAIGSSVRDLALVNEAGTAPTAGTGIKLAQGSQAYLDHVTILGFWNNVEVSGVYWHINSCHLYDPINYGLYVNASTPAYYDHADAGVFNSIISMMYRTNNAQAAIRWEAGGGARIIGNKINGYGQVGNSGAGRFAYGIDVFSTLAGLVDINITGNSMANFTACAIRLTEGGGPTNTTGAALGWVNITGNQINVVWGTTSTAIIVEALNEARRGQVRDISIAGNVLTNVEGVGIRVHKCVDVQIGDNMYYAVAGALVQIGAAGTYSGSSPYRISVGRQQTNLPNGTMFEDWRDIGSGGTMDGTGTHEYSRTFTTTAVNVDKSLYNVTPNRSGSVLMRLTIAGNGYGTARNFLIDQTRVLSRDGTAAAVVTTVGTDVAVGVAAAEVTITYDVTTVAGEVQIKAKTTNASFPNADCRVQMSLRGVVNKVARTS